MAARSSQRLGLLAAGDGEGLLKTGFCLRCIGATPAAAAIPLEPIQLRLAAALARVAPSRPAPRPARAAPRRSVRLPHTPRPAGPDNSGRHSSAPVAGRLPGPGGSAAMPSSSCPCMASAQPRRTVPGHPQRKPLLASPGSWRPLPAPGPPAPPGGMMERGRTDTAPAPGYRGAPAPGPGRSASWLLLQGLIRIAEEPQRHGPA